MLRPAVFLDRDRTLIQRKDGVDAADGLEALQLEQGAAAAVASIRGLGYKVVIVTNEDGVAQGKLTEDGVKAKHHKIRELIESKTSGAQVDAFYFCPYRPKSKVKQYAKAHADRVPKPGMWHKAAEDLGIDLAKSWTIAHSAEVCKAGKTAGTRTVHLNPAIAGKAHPDQPGGDLDYAVGSLIEAVRAIAQQRKPESAEEQRHSPKRWDKARIAELQRPRVQPGDGPRTYSPPPPKPFRPLDLPAGDTGDNEKAPDADNAAGPQAASGVSSAPAAKPTAEADPAPQAGAPAVLPAAKKKAKRVRRVKKVSAKPPAKPPEVPAAKPPEGPAAKPPVESTAKPPEGPAAKPPVESTAKLPEGPPVHTTAGVVEAVEKQPPQKLSPEKQPPKKQPSEKQSQETEPRAAKPRAGKTAEAKAPEVQVPEAQAPEAQAPEAQAQEATGSNAAALGAESLNNESPVTESAPAPATEQAARPVRLATASAPTSEPVSVIVSNQETERLLRQLLQETRKQSQGVGNVGSLHMLAIGLQAIALVCLLGGLFMNDDVFFRWLGAAVIAQLATMALLLFARR